MASPEPDVIAIQLPDGEGAVLRWDPVPGELRLESEPDWRRIESIRLVSARFEDGRVLGLAALRPRGARGHGDDVVVARLNDADGEPASIDEALVSVEFDARGEPRRLGIELWPPDSAPLRVAADRDREADPGAGVAPMRFRLDGVEGTGSYEVREGR